MKEENVGLRCLLMSLLLSKYVLFQMCKLFIGVYRLSLPYFDMASCVKFIKLFWPETFLNSSCLEILFVNLHWLSLQIKSCTDCYVLWFPSINLINTTCNCFYYKTFIWLFWLNDFFLVSKAAFLFIFSFAWYLNPTTKQHLINLISRPHQQLSVERSSKKSSEFYLSNENGKENSIDSLPKMKLKSQSVSSSNTDPDNDGNHLLYGY